MSTTRTLVTADELLKMPEIECRYELVKGELRNLPFNGAEHGAISARVGAKLGKHILDNRLGDVVGSAGFQIASDPDTVRAPDMAFIKRERIREGRLPEGYWLGAPDLVVEVISPFDSYAEVEERVIDWLTAGTRMVIVMNPSTRTVMVHTSPTEATRLTEADVLTCGDILPGFACPVSELFV